tara:strand:- start:160 stop:804 length:645 start_codon:yes stop_codon:yes gene_type:complete
MSHDDAKEDEEIPSIEQLKEGPKQEVKTIELYETCVDDKFDEAHYDRKKLVESMCVICLEIYDEQGIECVSHSKHINAKCECAYFVHRSCFQKWVQTRPTNSVNCLVCSSEGVLVLSYTERIKQVVTSRRFRKMLGSMFHVFCWISVFMCIWQIGIFVEQRENKVYGNERYYDDIYENNAHDTDIYEDDVYEDDVYEDDISVSNSRAQEKKYFI